jgi:hypothetical protein
LLRNFLAFAREQARLRNTVGEHSQEIGSSAAFGQSDVLIPARAADALAGELSALSNEPSHRTVCQALARRDSVYYAIPAEALKKFPSVFPKLFGDRRRSQEEVGNVQLFRLKISKFQLFVDKAETRY